jgi:hypothetical protein
MRERRVRTNLRAMHKLMIASVFLFAAACGGTQGSSSPSSPSPDPMGESAVSAGDAGSGAPSAQNVVNGSVGGVSVATADAIATLDDPTSPTTIYLSMSDKAGLCARQAAGTAAARSKTLEMVLYRDPINGGPASFTTGAYPVVPATSDPGLGAAALLASLDDGCSVGSTPAPSAVSGSIHVDALSATRLSGSFTLTFAGGDTLSGTFDAPVCVQTARAAGTPACAP